MKNKIVTLALLVSVILGCSTGKINTEHQIYESTDMSEQCRNYALKYISDKHGVHFANTLDKKVRTYEEIALVVDCYKKRIFDLYNLALSRNPNLSGKIIMAFEISKKGAVSDVNVIESELKDAILNEEIRNLFSQFKFNMAIDKFSVTFPIDFLPPSSRYRYNNASHSTLALTRLRK